METRHGVLERYETALRFALGRQANAYGFTLIIWGSGAIAMAQLGTPAPLDVFAFVLGATVSFSLVVAAVLGFVAPLQAGDPHRRAFSAMHLPSVPVAIGAAWGATSLLGGAAGYFASSFVAVGVFELLLGTEVALSLVRGTGRR